FIFSVFYFCVCFFFQAEDGIRDPLVTGVQTCALPIYAGLIVSVNSVISVIIKIVYLPQTQVHPCSFFKTLIIRCLCVFCEIFRRSEERRVGKECRSWCSPYH